MASFYDRADIYDLFEDENSYRAYGKHWETVLLGKKVKPCWMSASVQEESHCRFWIWEWN